MLPIPIYSVTSLKSYRSNSCRFYRSLVIVFFSSVFEFHQIMSQYIQHLWLHLIFTSFKIQPNNKNNNKKEKKEEGSNYYFIFLYFLFMQFYMVDIEKFQQEFPCCSDRGPLILKTKTKNNCKKKSCVQKKQCRQFVQIFVIIMML